MKKQSVLYWLSQVPLLWMMVGSAIYYFVKSEESAAAFVQLGYPAYTMYFNATAKILGGIVIVWPKFPLWLKEWAYAGYLYILLMAAQAVWMTMPGFPWPMLLCLAFWGLAYWRFKKRVA